MIKYFMDNSFTGKKMDVAKAYYDMALVILELTPGPESTVALRKLMESRDAAFRTLDNWIYNKQHVVIDWDGDRFRYSIGPGSPPAYDVKFPGMVRSYRGRLKTKDGKLFILTTDTCQMVFWKDEVIEWAICEGRNNGHDLKKTDDWDFRI